MSTPHHVLTVLTRLSQRRPTQSRQLRDALDGRLAELAPIAIQVGVETGDPIGRVLADCLASNPDPALAARLHPLIPDDTVALRELAVAVTIQYLDQVRAQDAAQGAQATLLNNLAGRLLDLGQPARAAALAEESVALYRRLVDGGRNTLRPGLAMALNTLSVAHAAAGETDQALEPARESVALYRQSVAGSDPATAALLAQSLNTLANRLMAYGRWPEALAAAQESVAIYSGLPGSPLRLGYLARALDTLSYAQIDCGHAQEAVQTSRRSQTLYRYLAEDDPDGYEPLLGVSCCNLAGILLRTLDYPGAERAALEAASIFSGLAAVRTDAFVTQFLHALLVQGLSACALDRHVDAQDTLHQAMDILAAFDPLQPWHRALVPEVREGLALALAGQGRLAEGIAEGERALAEYSNLPQQERAGHLPDLARCGVNLASIYLEAGDPLQALRALEEARGVYGLIRETAPDLFADALTQVLRLIAEVAMSVDDTERAFLALRQLLELVAPGELAQPNADALLAEASRRFSKRARPDRTEILELLDLLRSCIDEAATG